MQSEQRLGGSDHGDRHSQLVAEKLELVQQLPLLTNHTCQKMVNLIDVHHRRRLAMQQSKTQDLQFKPAAGEGSLAIQALDVLRSFTLLVPLAQGHPPTP